MSCRCLRAVGCVIALGAACSLTLSGTVSAYTDSVDTAANAFTAAPDWTAPTTAGSAIGRTSAYQTGFIAMGSTYYVYANLTDAGNPASGLGSATANVNSITSGTTAAALTAGSYHAGGTSYGYRSAALTAGASLAAGSPSYSITATDKASNAATQSFTTVVDNTAPIATGLQSTNTSGGTVGRLELGDTLTLTYSGTMDPYSILGGWTGAATAIQVALVDGGGTTSDYLLVYSTAATPVQLPLGTVTLGSAGYLQTGAGNYVVFGTTGAVTPSTMTQSGATITIKLGTPGAASSTSTTAAAMTWSPSTSATDIAGNATA
ncbi:MAG: hypothetical protein WAU75_24150, partial [Solirubrobacteraceae bacterium]